VGGLINGWPHELCSRVANLHFPPTDRLTNRPQPTNQQDRPTFAISAISWLMFMEQNLGPHMEQKWADLAGSWGRVASWGCRVWGCRVGGW
jgi:hypothetical protein